ncbi:putative T7SS-secreted protein [Streptomyces sp. NPDC101455]|uniref:putative T7SS-secreted protein n=1 Tax=Streptomyces sp. NPDC101455 TaxID=3366142 RepID=UPI003800A51D
MGIGDLVNSGLSKVGDAVDAGKKFTGELVDKGTDAAGDALDKVGAHDLANKVENAGDRIASDLGATPGEQQLGQSDQPKDLVHGDAKAIRATAKHLTDFYTAFDKVGDGMRRLNSSSWQGEAAEAFRRKFAMHPTKWLQAADACDAAGKALSSYAETVEWAQGQARDAIDLYGPGKKASDAYKADVAKHKDDDKKQEPSTDPGAAGMQRAHEILNEARRQRDETGRLTTRTNALGRTIEFERNTLGQVIRKNAAGQVTTSAYDMTDKPAQATAPGTILTVLRDRHGRVRSETVDDRELGYTYDGFGRRKARTTPSGATTAWTYDDSGRRTGMTASGRSIDFTYDEVGRELARQVGEMLTLEHTFDALGRLTTSRWSVQRALHSRKGLSVTALPREDLQP